jgi:replicative DNA helicase
LTTLPHTDPALEAAYIRSCIRLSKIAHLANGDERLSPDDCYGTVNAAILGAVLAAADARVSIDVITAREAVASLTGAANHLLAYDALMQGDVSKSVDRMAARLREHAKRRRRHNVLMLAVAASLDCRDDAVTEYALQVDSGETEARESEHLPGHDVVIESVNYFNSIEPGRERRTGFPILDKAIGSLQPGSLTVVGGYTGAGKSSLMLGMAVHQARAATPVCIVSLEDPLTTWGPRLAAHFTGINPTEVRPGMDEAVVSRTVAACEQLYGVGNLFFSFEIGRPLADVLRAIRHNVRKHKCKVVYVDYLQAIGWEPGRDESRRLHISHSVSAMKSLCASLGVALVLGSQLSRPEKGNEFKEPNLSSLKESGDIENMTEVAMLLWKSGDKQESLTLGKIAKVKWSPERPRFEVIRGKESGSVMDLQYVTSDAPPVPIRGGGYGFGT